MVIETEIWNVHTTLVSCNVLLKLEDVREAHTGEKKELGMACGAGLG